MLNGANEAAVGLFLAGKIPFGDIAERVARALADAPRLPEPALEDILAADADTAASRLVCGLCAVNFGVLLNIMLVILAR